MRTKKFMNQNFSLEKNASVSSRKRFRFISKTLLLHLENASATSRKCFRFISKTLLLHLENASTTS